MASYLVTGSSRGIGLAIVTVLLSKPATEVSKVFASARTETDNLKQLIAGSEGRVEWVPLEVTSHESAKQAASKVSDSLGGKGLDVLINNAGVGSKAMTRVEEMADIEDAFKVNVAGVHMITSTFLPLLRKGSLKKIINISTTLGSMSLAPNFTWGQAPAYKISKAALNMLTVQYALDLQEESFTVVAVSPGWNKTELVNSVGDLMPEEGAKATLDIVFRVTTTDNGKFYNVHVPGWENVPGPNKYRGEIIPW
ncbi:hypothetical protein SLS56_011636 [Neofusicoccum ribis]|uniref:Short chain oxidoreductase n=1 Tax=Neofusicoccum ribis TaxID=45134 RepID=A0ABR3SB35_9PEZI